VTDAFPWGKLEWYARESLNGASMTLGRCYIKPKMENAMHTHPNCDEVLYVVKGSVLHRLDGEEAEMNEGDSLFIPQGAVHNAFNPGNDEVLLAIAFTSGDRKTLNVQS
jgi:quercetin dioxygenase-like cupin family protein